MGGMIAQQIVVDRPDLVRRLILIGTGLRNGDGVGSLIAEAKAIFGASYNPPENLWLPVFFTQSEASQTAGRAFLKRYLSRTENRDAPVSENGVPAQLAAIEEWGRPVGEHFGYLKNIKQPALVVNGTRDIIVYTVNSLHLAQNMHNAKLIRNRQSCLRFKSSVATSPSVDSLFRMSHEMISDSQP
jgi:pimeloyl-ACP methyl ester carboxylesterase